MYFFSIPPSLHFILFPSSLASISLPFTFLVLFLLFFFICTCPVQHPSSLSLSTLHSFTLPACIPSHTSLAACTIPSLSSTSTTSTGRVSHHPQLFFFSINRLCDHSVPHYFQEHSLKRYDRRPPPHTDRCPLLGPCPSRCRPPRLLIPLLHPRLQRNPRRYPHQPTPLHASTLPSQLFFFLPFLNTLPQQHHLRRQYPAIHPF